MNKVSKAPVTLGHSNVPERPPGTVLSLLGQLESSLEKLIASGEQGTIDIQALPVHRQALADCLGSGDVEANVEALGRTHVRETGICGVWWVTHYNMSSEIVAEIIEICEIPEIFRAHPAQLRSSLEQLRSLRTRVAASV
jgi:hydrogenase-1 operon protein HyaF